MKSHANTGTLYKPALTIIAMVLVLLAVIVVSTYRNLQREENNALTSVHRLGRVILKSIETGARSGMMMHGMGQADITHLVTALAGDPNIAYFYILGDRDAIVAGSRSAPPEIPADWHTRLKGDTILARIKKEPDGTRIYEMAKPFTPRPPQRMMRMMPMDSRMPARMQKMMRRHMAGDLRAGSLVVIGLKMDSYEAGRRADLRHAFLMGGILLALGSSAIFFLFVIQNYYITKRHLKQSQDFSHLVTNSMADGLVSINRRGDIVYSNRQARDMLGLDKSGPSHRNLKDIIDLTAVGIDATLVDGRPVTHREVRLPRPDGDDMVLGITASPLKGTDQEGAVIVFRDLTRIRALESKVIRAEKLAAVGTLAAGVAHEIRNPLSSIRGFARFLHHRLQDRPREMEAAGVMVEEIDRINKVVTHLLDLARPMSLEKTATDIAALLSHVVTLTRPDTREKDITVKLNPADAGPPVLLDRNKMVQTLLNLILNSVHAVDNGGVIRIGARHLPEERQLRIWVEDNGGGIARTEADRIFDPYYTTRAGGTGLGLAIVGKIVAAHGGQVRIDSPVPDGETGCRVTLLLPVNPATTGLPTPETQGEADVAADTRR